MALLTEYSDIRISRLSVPPIIPAVQGDTGRQLVFTPTDYTIPADCTATYYIQKPSGNAVYNNATIEDGKVICDLTAQALAENGDNYGQIRIMKDEEVVTSFDFVLLVKPFRGIDAIESTTEMNIFDKAVEQAEEAIEAAAQEAEEYISQAIDDTLTIEGKAADAKATGDAITNVASDLSDLSDTVSGQGDRLDTAENDIDGLQGDMTTAQGNISTLQGQMTTAQEDIGTLQGDVSDLDEAKASTDGTYENLTAGTAEQLLSDTGIEDSTPYTFRRSKAGSREYDEVVGGSIVYNQGCNSEASASWHVSGGTGSFADGVYTFTASASGGGAYMLYGRKVGHIYYHGVDVKLTTAGTYAQLNHYGGNPKINSVATTAWQRIECIYSHSATSDSSTRMNLVDTRSADWDAIQCKNFMSVDLTQMFGAAVAQHIADVWTQDAQAGCKLFRDMMGDGYLPYNSTGELMSVSGVSAHVMTGFNQWDEEWEVGSIDNTTGQNVSNSGILRSTNYIPVFPSTQYYMLNHSGYTFAYDGAKNYIGTFSINNAPTPSNCHYIRFRLASNYGTTYKNDICINLSDPTKNGTYKPYAEYRYPLDSSLTLRGVPKVVDGKICYDGDVYASDGTVTRKYAIHTFTGTESLTMLNAETEGWKVFAFNPTPSIVNNSFVVFMSDVGESVPYSEFSTANLTCRLVTHYGIGIRFALPCTSVADAKIDLTGKSIIYQLATPTTESALPYQHLQIVDAGGTEEYVTTGLVPVGHNTKYPTDLVAKVDGLPSDFSTLIAPTEAQMVATRNYNTGALFIVNNVLYKATANIANGGAITPGTNCLATTLAEVISALA